MTTKSAGAYNHINYTTETEYKSFAVFFFAFRIILINLLYGCIISFACMHVCMCVGRS